MLADDDIVSDSGMRILPSSLFFALKYPFVNLRYEVSLFWGLGKALTVMAHTCPEEACPRQSLAVGPSRHQMGLEA